MCTVYLEVDMGTGPQVVAIPLLSPVPLEIETPLGKKDDSGPRRSGRLDGELMWSCQNYLCLLRVIRVDINE